MRAFWNLAAMMVRVLAVAGLFVPLTSHALLCEVAGATLTLVPAVCSTYEIRAQMDAIPNVRGSRIESPTATAMIGDSLLDADAGHSVRSSAQVQTDYGLHRLSVSSFTTAPELATGHAGALSMWQDAIFASGNIGDSFTIHGHVHAVWLGTGELGDPVEHAYEYSFSSGFASGITVENQPFGSEGFHRISQNSPQLLVDHTFIDFSVTYSLREESGSVLLVSRLLATAGENRQVDMLQTASIDRIVASDNMTIWSSSGTLQGGDGIFTFAAVTQVPEPATLALLAIGLAGLGFSRRKRT